MKNITVTPGAINRIYDRIGLWDVKKTYGQSDFTSQFAHTNSSATLNVNELIRMVYIDCWLYTTSALSTNTAYVCTAILSDYRPKYYDGRGVATCETSSGQYAFFPTWVNKDSGNLVIYANTAIPINKWIRVVLQYIY